MPGTVRSTGMVPIVLFMELGGRIISHNMLRRRLLVKEFVSLFATQYISRLGLDGEPGRKGGVPAHRRVVGRVRGIKVHAPQSLDDDVIDVMYRIQRAELDAPFVSMFWKRVAGRVTLLERTKIRQKGEFSSDRNNVLVHSIRYPDKLSS